MLVPSLPLAPAGLALRFAPGEAVLRAVRIAIDGCREMVAYLGSDDPTTRRMLEGILAMEEEHADDLVSLLEEMGSG